MSQKAVFLAAGMGTRLLPLTENTHKCLTEVNNVPIVINALSNLHSVGVTETVMVVGYLADNVKKTIGDMYENMNIAYVENNLYKDTNTSYSLRLGLEKLKEYDTVYILEGDVFFEKSILEKLYLNSCPNISVLEPYNESLDGTFVTINDNSYITDWIHKNDRAKDFTFDNKYKTVNIHKFSKEFIENTLLPVLNKMNNMEEQRNPLEKAMKIIVNQNSHIIYGMNTDGAKWVEIDDINDLKLAKKVFGGEISGEN